LVGASRRFTVHALLEVDVTEPRARIVNAEPRVSWTGFVIATVARAVALHPEVNARKAGNRMLYFDHVDVGATVERLWRGRSTHQYHATRSDTPVVAAGDQRQPGESEHHPQLAAAALGWESVRGSASSSSGRRYDPVTIGVTPMATAMADGGNADRCDVRGAVPWSRHRCRRYGRALPHRPVARPRAGSSTSSPGDDRSMTNQHRPHDPTEHDHVHGDGCGHRAVPHDEHLDYLHNGHWHAPHDGHYDEHLNLDH
jgi:hypothetical protein